MTEHDWVWFLRGAVVGAGLAIFGMLMARLTESVFLISASIHLWLAL